MMVRSRWRVGPIEVLLTMQITYQDTTDGIKSDNLNGFFVGWPNPPSPETHLRILKGSDYVVLAVSSERFSQYDGPFNDAITLRKSRRCRGDSQRQPNCNGSPQIRDT